jgi:hypothetical protein
MKLYFSDFFEVSIPTMEKMKVVFSAGSRTRRLGQFPITRLIRVSEQSSTCSGAIAECEGGGKRIPLIAKSSIIRFAYAQSLGIPSPFVDSINSEFGRGCCPACILLASVKCDA